jgi:hypothetical protein
MKLRILTVATSAICLMASVAIGAEPPPSSEEMNRAQSIRADCESDTILEMAELQQRAKEMGAEAAYKAQLPNGVWVEITQTAYYRQKVMQCFIKRGLEDPVLRPRMIQYQGEPPTSA